MTFRTTAENPDSDSVDSSGSYLGRDSQHPATSCFEVLKKGKAHGFSLVNFPSNRPTDLEASVPLHRFHA